MKRSTRTSRRCSSRRRSSSCPSQKTQTLGVEWVVGGAANGSKIIGGNIISTSAATGGALVPLAAGIAANPAATALGALKSGLNIGVVGQTINFGGISFPSVQSFVQALAADVKTNVLATPQLLTLNNEEAEVIIGSNVPYTTSVRLDSAGNPITNFDYRDVGVKLKVKPYINKDGLVYLNIFTEVTQITSTLATVGSATARADDDETVHEDDGRRQGRPDHRHKRHHPGYALRHRTGQCRCSAPSLFSEGSSTTVQRATRKRISSFSSRRGSSTTRRRSQR